MKKIVSTLSFLLPVFFLFVFIGCHKDNGTSASKPKLILTGNVYDCWNNLADTGYVTILIDGASHQVNFRKGAFTTTVERKDTTTVPVTITPFDVTHQYTGPAKTLNADTGTVHFDYLFACTSDQWVTYDGVVGVYSPGRSSITYTVHGSQAVIAANALMGSYGPNYYLYAPVFTGTGSYTLDSLDALISSSDWFRGYGLSCTVTAFGGVGGYITGTYIGRVRRYGYGFETNPYDSVKGTFQVKRTQ